MGRIRVGKPAVRPDAPTHVKGIIEGNAPGAYEHQVGHHLDGRADARRSTGIQPRKHEPLVDAMPNISPG